MFTRKIIQKSKNTPYFLAGLLIVAIVVSIASSGLLKQHEIPDTAIISNENTAANGTHTSKTSTLINQVTLELSIKSFTEIYGTVLGQTDQGIEIGFQVWTDFGYFCSEGDPSQAIQDAIYSLPQPRYSPLNIYLRGTFSPVCNIVMDSNVNFIGTNALLINESPCPIFIHEWGKPSVPPFGEWFEISGELYHDWVTLQNVTFQTIHFKQLCSYDTQENCAIYFYDGNTTGWGRSNNISVYNCQFEGFYNCIQGIAMNSQYIGNYFHDYSNNAIMFPLGYNLKITHNIIDTPSNPLTVQEYQERDGDASIRGGIGLFLMDIDGFAAISNNNFVEGTNATGITFSSCIGQIIVTDNIFSGIGQAYSVDVFPRPWLSYYIQFQDNIGANDFYYENGAWTNSITAI
jgi:hypothetical protein